MPPKRQLQDFFAPSSKKVAITDDLDKVAEENITPTTSAVLESSDDWQPLVHLNKDWKELMMAEFGKSYFSSLRRFVDGELSKNLVYPRLEDTFTSLNLCPYDDVKVVIVGQDPYHGPGQAHGLAFSVMAGVAVPPSLRNIIAEAQKDVGISKPTHGNLQSWSRQGVLLLNTVLTVQKGNPNSHQKKGWETFTDAIIRELGKKQQVVYLLWGAPAQAKCKSIDPTQNTIICTSHPSPLGAYKTGSPFMGSKCFSRCNAALASYGKSEVNWNSVNDRI